MSQGAANRRKGAACERAVCSFLRENGFPDARRHHGADGKAPGDIEFHELVCLEVKNRKASAWPTWCRQAETEARPGTVPIVVRKTPGVTNVGLWESRFHLDSWVQCIGGGAMPFESRHEVDGEAWWGLPFGWIVSALEALDR